MCRAHTCCGLGAAHTMGTSQPQVQTYREGQLGWEDINNHGGCHSPSAGVSAAEGLTEVTFLPQG